MLQGGAARAQKEWWGGCSAGGQPVAAQARGGALCGVGVWRGARGLCGGGMPRAWQKNTGTLGGGVSSGRASCIDTRERPGGSGGPTGPAPV